MGRIKRKEHRGTWGNQEAGLTMLSQEQVNFFKTKGYLIVPGAMAIEQCRKVRELMWQALPDNSSLQAGDLVSHIGPFKQEDEASDARHLRQGYVG